MWHPLLSLVLRCLCSGGPTWSKELYRVLPTNQDLIQSLPPRNCHCQWRHTNSRQLQSQPDVLMHSGPPATHNNCDTNVRSAVNFLPASAATARSSPGHHHPPRTCPAAPWLCRQRHLFPPAALILVAGLFFLCWSSRREGAAAEELPLLSGASAHFLSTF